MKVSIKEEDNKGKAYVEVEGKTMAQMTYSKAGEDKIIIDHTEVDASLKGQGVGKQLLSKLVEMAREKGIKILPLCPFAHAMFRKDASLKDVWA